MNAFQIIVLPVLALLFMASMVSGFKGWTRRRVALFWSLSWLAAGAAVAWPDLTRRIAKPLGIDRGADLAVYCALLLMFVGFYMVYARLRRLEASVTKLVRHLALTAASRPSKVEGQGSKVESEAPDGSEP